MVFRNANVQAIPTKPKAFAALATQLNVKMGI